jgi:uncharacterized protein YdhG (YjbR/CyaY superfamily)
MTMIKVDSIDAYIADQPEELRPLLQKVRETIRSAAPDAVEKISWQMPTFWQKENLIHFAAAMEKWGVTKKIFAIFAASFALEILQFALAIGRSDITDLLLNTVGGAIGICGFWLIKKLFNKRTEIIVLILCGLIAAFVLYCSVCFIALGYLPIGRVKF